MSGTTPPHPTALLTVTGAGGFIGSRVVEHALAALPGWRLRLVAHRTPLAVAPEHAHRVETVPGDLTDPRSLRGLCADSDALLHCASRVGGPADACEAVNALGTEALVAEARRAGVRRVVQLGTAAVYGRGPFHGASPDELPLAPASDTSRTRAAGERAVLDAGGVVLRPHVVYGTGDRWVGPGIVAMLRLLDGTVDGWPAMHSLIEADDLARALVATAVAPEERLTRRVYHANHPEPVRAVDMMRGFADATGVPWSDEKLAPDEARDRLARAGGSTHHLGIVTVDHHFDSRPLWTDLGLDPGPGFPTRLHRHAPWYAATTAA